MFQMDNRPAIVFTKIKAVEKIYINCGSDDSM